MSNAMPEDAYLAAFDAVGISPSSPACARYRKALDAAYPHIVKAVFVATAEGMMDAARIIEEGMEE